MNIVVCIKQVPDTTEVKLDPKTGTLIRDGVPSIINPDDKAGIEAALRIKEAIGGKVTVLTMGPPQAEAALRETFAMGCDEAILLSDRAFAGSDTWATSSTLAAALKQLDYDLIITGRQAIDGDTAQVGPQIAEHLHIPQVSYVSEITAEEGKITVRREYEDRYHIIEVKTPCLITALAELNEPRYMSIALIMASYSKTITNWSLEDIKANVDTNNLGLAGSPTRVMKSFTKTLKGAGKVYKDLDPDEAVKLIVNEMQTKHLL